MTTDEKLDLILNKLSEVDARLDNVDARLDKLEAAQLQTTATLEGTVNKCIQVLYESHNMNAERLDKFDIESIKRNTEIAVTLAKIVSDKVEQYIKQTA